jgi:hypothetical protein
MFAVAIASWVVTVVPPPLWIVLAFHVVPVAVLTTCVLGAIYLRGGLRAFCLGFALTLLQVIVLTFLLVEGFDYGFIARHWQVMALVPVLCIVFPGAMGFVAAYFHNVSERARQKEIAVARAVVEKAKQQARHRPKPIVREVLEIRDEAEEAPQHVA